MPFRLTLLTAMLSLAAFAQPREAPDPGGPVPPPAVTPDQEFELWPGMPPDEPEGIGEEIMLVARRRYFYQITNVTKPTVSVYLPDPAKATGAAVMVIPGGGLARLAIETEGYEVSKWLRDQGIAAFMVKYRVPSRGEDFRERYKAGVQDAQRAFSLVRARAEEFHIDPDGIGAIGFSAGGEIGTWLALFGADERQYEAVDAADGSLTRPAFMINIYPGGLTSGFGREEPKVRDGILSRLNEHTPPMFFAHAFPDASINSILMLAEMRKRNIPAELHVFQQGAHAFAVRQAGMPFGVWPQLALSWMRGLGFLDPPAVRSHAAELTKAFEAHATKLPKSSAGAKTPPTEAYSVQKRVIARAFGKEKIVGYKGAASSAAAQKNLKISAPLHCALFEPAVHHAAKTAGLAADADGVVETEIGYIMGVDIPTAIADPAEARSTSTAVVPVIELPKSSGAIFDGKISAADMIASNCGGETRILVGPESHPDKVDLEDLAISIEADGKSLGTTNAKATRDGQWRNLMTLINQIVAQGRVIRQGDIILSGAIGAVHPAKVGSYKADYGELGTVEFELR